MARTPLLRAVQRLANEQHTYSRREFLKRTGVVGAAAALGPVAMPGKAGAASPRIAIVGGGISGLNAALTLADKGYGATIYEASTRVGGRMHSETGYFSDGQVAEFCGELIDTGH